MSRTVWRTSLGMSTYVVVVISPATSTSPVVSRVSQATRLSGSSVSSASSTESEIWSAILSGCPSVTDSEVKVYRLLTAGSILGCLVVVRPGGADGRCRCRAAVRRRTACPGGESPDGGTRGRQHTLPAHRAGTLRRGTPDQRDDPVQHRVGHGPLGAQGDRRHGAVGPEHGHLVGVVVEPDPWGGHVVGHHPVDPLGHQLGPGPLRDVVRL